jgi:hypothetical protein
MKKDRSAMKSAPQAQLPWPRLSQDLGGTKHPNLCQSCGAEHDLSDGIGSKRFQEHDDEDQPEPIVLVLCRDCQARLIDPHPRLYRRLDPNEPWPGCMTLCLDCRHRTDVTCTHPDLKSNGGPGLTITMRKPITAHVTMARGRGYWSRIFLEPPTACAGKEPQCSP